jgi:uncharacterized RDD family membrane protein YckC
MDRRFDEVDLLTVAELAPAVAVPSVSSVIESAPAGIAPRWRRFLALAIDISLFLALALVLSPLLPLNRDPITLVEEAWPILLGGSGFLLLLSYYYFTGSWLIWGKTLGSAIFDLRVVADDGAALSARAVSQRWVATLLSLVTGGVGFLPGLLPSARTVADRLSSTHSVRT